MSGPKGVDYFIGDGTPALAGDAFVVIKASEGAGFPGAGAPELTWYPEEQARIRRMGAMFGAFHFWHPSVDNAAQLANFKQRANLAPGDLIQLDAEVTDGLSWPVVNTRKNDMLGLLKAEFPQNRVLLYTFLDYWNHLDGHAGDGLWIADPDAPPGQPRVPAWVIHQYGSGGVDYDIANFPDAASMRAWATGLIPTAEDPMSTFQTGRVEPGFYTDASGAVNETNATVIVVPPSGGGALKWGPAWLNLGCDFESVTLRVAVKVDGVAGWGVSVHSIAPTDDRLSIPLPAGAGKISIGRVAQSATDDPAAPCGWMIEQG